MRRIPILRLEIEYLVNREEKEDGNLGNSDDAQALLGCSYKGFGECAHNGML